MRLGFLIWIALCQMTEVSIACQDLSRAFFAFNAGQPGSYKGYEKLRYFIGEVIEFNPQEKSPIATMRVLRDYGAADFSTKMVLMLPPIAIMKVNPFDTTCGPYELKNGDIGVFASYEKGGELWLAWFARKGF